MKTRQDYQAALAVVGDVVRAWDPYSLLEQDCPSDEFDGEIAKIVTYIPRMASPSDCAAAISSVFSAAFEADSFTPAYCSTTGDELFAKLVDAGLISKP